MNPNGSRSASRCEAEDADLGSSTRDLKRYRDKSLFINADDPDRALRSFFEQLASRFALSDDPAIGKAPRLRSPPLLLISQLPRSGGSLFSQLCDHHPQLLTFPFELRISAQKTVWPELDPTENPARLFARLFQGELCRLAVEGYRKRAKARQYQRLKFNYSPRRHYLSFIDLLNAPRNARDVLDAFFSAFFQAWPDGRCADPRFIVAFAPKVAIRPKSVAAFFTDYPDGGLVTIIRNPADWFVSRRAHTANGVAPHADLDIEMTHWNRLARAALKYHRKYAERFLLLSFRELVRSRESTMRRFSEWCGIDFDPALTRQTFANKPIAPNTNFLDPPEGLSEAVLHRASVLEDDQRSRALELTSSMRELLEDAGCRC